MKETFDKNKFVHYSEFNTALGKCFMKKKIFVLVSLVTIAVTSAMANTEIDLNYYITPIIQRGQAFEPSSKNTTVVPSFVGLEGNFNWFFGKNAGIFDIGLNLDTGVHMITGKATITATNATKFKPDNSYTGVGLFLSLGPVLRFTFTDMFSFSFTPGLQLGFDIAGYKTTSNNIKIGDGFLDLSLAVSINAAAKIWLLHKKDFRLGLNIGADVDFPFTGIYSNMPSVDNTVYLNPTNLAGNAKYAVGMNLRFFIGVALQFGDRAYDRTLAARDN